MNQSGMLHEDRPLFGKCHSRRRFALCTEKSCVSRRETELRMHPNCIGIPFSSDGGILSSSGGIPGTVAFIAHPLEKTLRIADALHSISFLDR